MAGIIGFDVGNTLLHIDGNRVSNLLVDYGHSIPACQICDAERHARFAVDKGLLLCLEAGHTLRSGSASMDSTHLWRQYFANLLGLLGVSSLHHIEIMTRLLEIEGREIPGLWSSPLPGTEPMLAGLKQRDYLLAAVSNSDGRLRQKLASVNLHQYFDLIVDSKEEGIEKPDAKIFHVVVERLHCRGGGHFIYIGDLYSVDVLGARKAGYDALLFDPGNLYRGIADDAISGWDGLTQYLQTTSCDTKSRGAR
jgi:HAD superfamily hydrolase (TIGR01509 family)